MCLFQLTGKQRHAPIRSEAEPFLVAKSRDSREVAEQQAVPSWCWVGRGRKGSLPQEGGRPARWPGNGLPSDHGPWTEAVGLKDRVFSEGCPARLESVKAHSGH